MNVILLKAMVALVPACILFSGAVVWFSRGKTVFSSLQLLGAGCLVVVVLTHVSEALHLFPWTHWGRNDSIGHYLDLWSAILGLTLFPLGYLLHALGSGNSTRGRVRIMKAVVGATVIYLTKAAIKQLRK